MLGIGKIIIWYEGLRIPNETLSSKYIFQIHFSHFILWREEPSIEICFVKSRRDSKLIIIIPIENLHLIVGTRNRNAIIVRLAATIYLDPMIQLVDAKLDLKDANGDLEASYDRIAERMIGGLMKLYLTAGPTLTSRFPLFKFPIVI